MLGRLNSAARILSRPMPASRASQFLNTQIPGVNVTRSFTGATLLCHAKRPNNNSQRYSDGLQSSLNAGENFSPPATELFSSDVMFTDDYYTHFLENTNMDHLGGNDFEREQATQDAIVLEDASHEVFVADVSGMAVDTIDSRTADLTIRDHMRRYEARVTSLKLAMDWPLKAWDQPESPYTRAIADAVHVQTPHSEAMTALFQAAEERQDAVVTAQSDAFDESVKAWAASDGAAESTNPFQAAVADAASGDANEAKAEYMQLFAMSRARWLATKEREFKEDVAALKKWCEAANEAKDEEEVEDYGYDDGYEVKQKEVEVFNLDTAPEMNFFMEAVAEASIAKSGEDKHEAKREFFLGLKEEWLEDVAMDLEDQYEGFAKESVTEGRVDGEDLDLQMPNGDPNQFNFFKTGQISSAERDPENPGQRRLTPDDVAKPRNLNRNDAKKIPEGELRYTNLSMLREYVSDSGTILPRRLTGISAKDQRKISKMIKKARVMGLIPHVGGWEVRHFTEAMR